MDLQLKSPNCSEHETIYTLNSSKQGFFPLEDCHCELINSSRSRSILWGLNLIRSFENQF
jgi:hypothetical protein